MLNKSFASLYKLGDSQVSMAVPNFLSSDSGIQTLHYAFRSFTPPGGFVYGDKETASSMVTVLFRFRMTYGPRTRYFRIFLNDNRLQKPIVRGPYFFEGTANKVILHYIVSQWITKSCCSRSAAPAGSCINPSATAKLKYVLFSVIPYGSADPSLRLTAASMVTRKRLRLW